MMICINGGYGNMNPEEAAQLTAEIEPAVVIPMHWGLVAENTSDPADFVRALAEDGQPGPASGHAARRLLRFFVHNAALRTRR